MRYALLLTILLALSPASIARQDLIVNVNLRSLDVFVEDENGRAVLDLTANDFIVFEDGQVKPVKHLSLEAQPVAVGFVVDRSISIAPVKNDLDQAVGHVVGATHPGDQLFLMTIAGANKLSVGWTTRYPTILEKARKTKLGFGSRVYDALVDSLEYLSTSNLDRKALILFSDGADHYSAHTFQQVADIAVLYRIPIFVLGYVGDDSRTWSKSGRRDIQRQFEHLARSTGGNAFFAGDQTDCSKVAIEILQRVQYEYRIGFYSSGPLTVSRDIQVKLRDGASRRVITEMHNRFLNLGEMVSALVLSRHQIVNVTPPLLRAKTHAVLWAI